MHQLATHELASFLDDVAELFGPLLLRPLASDGQVLLAQARQPLDLGLDRTQQVIGLVSRGRQLFLEQLQVQRDRRQRISDLVRDVRRHLANRRQPFRRQQLLVGARDRAHHAFEGGRQLTDLVVGDYRRPRLQITQRDGLGSLGHQAERQQHAPRVNRHAGAGGQRRQRERDQ